MFKKGDKRKVRRFSVEPTQNKGFNVRVEHHPKAAPEGKGAKMAFASPYMPDETYGHDNADDAGAHVKDLLNRMSPTPPGASGAS